MILMELSPLSCYIILVLAAVFSIASVVIESQQPEFVTDLFPPPPPLPPPPLPVLPPPPSSGLPPAQPLSPSPSPSPSPFSPLQPSPLLPPDNQINDVGQPPPSREDEINNGKKVGLMFVGVASILQIFVAGFLVFKRRQLMRIKDDNH